MGVLSVVHAANTRPCYFNKMPPEIISQILLAALEDLGDVCGRFGFPLLHRRISTRFYHIINNNRRFWRYLYIRRPVHKYIHNHITRSEPLSLLADVEYSWPEEPGEDGGWREMLEALDPAYSRLGGLIITSEEDNEPIFEILRHQMPMLRSLDIKGNGHQETFDQDYQLHSTQFPVLQTLRLFHFLQWTTGHCLPPTVEELRLDVDHSTRTRHVEHFWDLLPLNIRTLELGYLIWTTPTPPSAGKFHLPRLTNISFSRCWDPEELSNLRFLDAPSLRRLTVHTGDQPESMAGISWALEFPALTDFTWESSLEIPQMAHFLRPCCALISVHIKNTGINLPGATNFVNDLASDPTILPRLEDLAVFGSSIHNLKKVAQDRSSMKRLEIDRGDLTPKGDISEQERMEWGDCVAWVSSHLELVAVDHFPTGGPEVAPAHMGETGVVG